MTRPQILGIPADPVTFAEWLDYLDEWIKSGDRLHQVCTINPEFIVMARSNSLFREVLNNSDLNVIDGWGAVWALRWQGVNVPERVTGSDGVPMIAERAAERGWKLYLLGAGEGVAALTAEIFRQKFPAIQIVGVDSRDPDEASIEAINHSGADILLVAYGAPQQDLWIYRHREQLQVKVAIGVGGSFDFITGYVPRAPLWMRQWGLEWLYRLYLQPSRWRRMLRLPLFVVWNVIDTVK